jgi:hypothetical protein
MTPNPGEEGLGRRARSFDLLGALLIPKDPRGIVLACGFLALAAIAINTVVAGDWIGFGYLLAAAIGYFFVQTRFVPAVLWLLIAVAGVLGATAGNASGWIVAVLGGVLALVSIVRPAELDEQSTSRKLEVGPSAPQLNSAMEALPDNETSRNLEVHGHLDKSNGWVKAEELEATSAVAPPAATRIVLRTIGALSLEVDGRSQIQRLRDQPRLEFLLSYLVARSVWARDVPVERAAIAEEMAAGIAPTNQLDRLRKTLHAFQTALGTGLKGLIRISATNVRLDLTGVDADFVALAEMASRVSRRPGLIDAPLAEDVRALLGTIPGEFLPGFSELEHQVTGGRGSAHGAVEEARSRIAGWRADLTAALARHLDAAGRPQASIVYLQSALAQSQDREDLARLLVAAYMQTGQTARAEEIRLEYGLSSGEAR